MSESEKLNVCLSGGAEGADTEWGHWAKTNGHEVVHWIFDGYKSSSIYAVEIPKDMLLEADQFLIRANKQIKRKYPTNNEFINNLLRRNYWQVKDTDAVYAVSNFVYDHSLLQIDGGTHWAVQMYLDICYDQNKNPKIYFFDQNSNNWNTWIAMSDEWLEINVPPQPSGLYTGIGSRKLLPNGAKAIKNCF